MKPQKPIQQLGKKGKAWLLFRINFLRGKKNHEGYYVCEMEGCGKWVEYPEIDHIANRSTNPDKVFDVDNLRILCTECHRSKHNQ